MKIIEMLAPIIPNGARSGLKRTGFRGVTVHNTGNADKGSDADNHGAYLQNTGKNNQASWHYAVDENCAVRSIPEDEIAWHGGDGGSGDGNCKTIALEICMNSDGDLLKATDNAAELTADILKRNGIAKAVSGQNVFQHNFWNGKNCPQMIRAGKPYDWNTFIAKVNSHLGVTPQPKPVTPTPTTKYSVGQTVTINGVYTSSTSTQKLVPLVNSGKITSIIPTAPNPYLLNGGDIGWVNDSCIVTKAATVVKPQTSSTLKVGDKVRVTSRTDYNGVVNFSWVLDVMFDVMEINGNRVVIGRNGQVTGAWAKSNLKKV